MAPDEFPHLTAGHRRELLFRAKMQGLNCLILHPGAPPVCPPHGRFWTLVGEGSAVAKSEAQWRTGLSSDLWPSSLCRRSRPSAPGLQRREQSWRLEGSVRGIWAARPVWAVLGALLPDHQSVMFWLQIT